MKILSKILLGILLLSTILVTSCNYLDEEPDDILTLEMTFNDVDRVEGWLSALYNLVIDPMWTGAYGYGFPMLSDDAQIPLAQAEWGGWEVKAQQGNWSASSNYETELWAGTYKKVRSSYLFQENIHAIEEEDLDQDDVEQMKLEARFLVAYYYSKMLEIYGPFPLVTSLVDAETDYSALMMQRTPYDSIVNWLDAELLDLSEQLPVEYDNPTSNYGRPTKGAALATRARVLLNAASPLFNGNEDFADMVNPDGTHIFSTEYDASKWTRAADAYKLVIDMAEEGVYELYTETNNDGTIDPFMSYKELFLTSGETNTEIIWSRPSNDAYNWHFAALPRGTGAYGFFGITQSLVDEYQDKNGFDIDDASSVYSETGYSSSDTYYDTKWDMNEDGTEGLVTPSGTFNMYINREPRFYVTVAYNGSWIPQDDRVCRFQYSGSDGGPSTDAPPCGYLVRKSLHDDAEPQDYYNPTLPGILIRLGEIYLSYAEALNESEEYRNSTDITKYINIIRERAGLPDIDETLLGNHDAMQKAIRHERRVEMALEGDIRYNDIRRWKVAKELIDNVPVMGMDMDERGDDFYVRTEYMTRTFDTKMYLYPIWQDYLDNNPNLIQNYGW